MDPKSFEGRFFKKFRNLPKILYGKKQKQTKKPRK